MSNVGFWGEGKPENPEKNLSEQSREPTNSTHIWRRVEESNPGHIGGKRVLSPLRHPYIPHIPISPYPHIVNDWKSMIPNINCILEWGPTGYKKLEKKVSQTPPPPPFLSVSVNIRVL